MLPMYSYYRYGFASPSKKICWGPNPSEKEVTEWALVHYDWSPYKREIWTHGQTCIEGRNTGKTGSSPHHPQKERSPLPSRLQTSNL